MFQKRPFGDKNALKEAFLGTEIREKTPQKAVFGVETPQKRLFGVVMPQKRHF